MRDELEIPAPDTGMLFYQTEDGKSRIQVRLQDGTVWLSQRPLAKLYQWQRIGSANMSPPSAAITNSSSTQLIGNSE